MNWKEQPRLFVGKFSFVGHNDKQENITGVRYFSESIWLEGEHDNDMHDIVYCQLIARPISDMSDEEISELNPTIQLDRHHLINAIENNELMFVEFKNLINKGVYPFDDTTDVIWRYEND